MTTPAASSPTAPWLVLAWGNRSRGDDALGPLLADALLRERPGEASVEVIEDQQLQPEHLLDLVGRQGVLLVDASRRASAPFDVSTVEPARDASFTSHALSPRALLQAYVDVLQAPPPPCTLLALRGEQFGLGEPLSGAGQRHLAAALAWARAWLDDVQALPVPDRAR